MDFNQIQELIRLVSKSKVSEFILKEGEFKLIIRNQGSASEAGAAAAPVAIPAAPVAVITPAPALPAAAVAPGAAAPKTDTQAPAAEPPAPAVASTANLLTIKSPMVGTFYRAPSPDKGPYVKVGDTVDKGTTVCMIEAMKLFNEIESEIKGKIVKVLAEDASPVEYDQPLFLVDPA